MPDVPAIQRAALNCRSEHREVRFHAVLSKDQVIPGFHVTPLHLAGRAKCLYMKLRKLAHGPGPEYLYKPLLPWILPRFVLQAIILDTDTIVLRDIYWLWSEFRNFGRAVIGE